MGDGVPPWRQLGIHHRVIVALAQAHGVTVLTSDENIRKYAGVRTLW